MTLEDQITALLAEAEPLRCLADDDERKEPLGAIVDRINALRAIQADAPVPAMPDASVDMSAEAFELRARIAAQPIQLPARRPGRPRKAA